MKALAAHVPRIYYIHEDGERVARCRTCRANVVECDVCHRPACEGSLMAVMEPEGAAVCPCCADKYDRDGYRMRRRSGR